MSDETNKWPGTTIQALNRVMLDETRPAQELAEQIGLLQRLRARIVVPEIDLEKGVPLSIAAALYSVYGDIGWGPAEEIHFARGTSISYARHHRGLAREKLSELGASAMNEPGQRCMEEKLAAGKLRGTGLLRGRSPPDPPRVLIPADYWPRLTLDYVSSSAVAPNFELMNILIFPVWPGVTDAPPPGGPAVARRRGPPPVERERMEVAMRRDIASGRITVEELRDLKQDALGARYHGSRTTAVQALKNVLSEFGIVGVAGVAGV